MATNPPLDLVLRALDGPSLSVREWLTTFPLLFVAVDPGNRRSQWILPTAARILTDYDQADCRVAWLVGGDELDANRFLGRRAREILTFVDPELEVVSAFGLGSLPAVVHLAMTGEVVTAVEGWDPLAWRALTVKLSRSVGWSRPVVPAPKDPGAFAGAPIRSR